MPSYDLIPVAAYSWVQPYEVNTREGGRWLYQARSAGSGVSSFEYGGLLRGAQIHGDQNLYVAHVRPVTDSVPYSRLELLVCRQHAGT